MPLHRWLGGCAAVFLLSLALTGLCLNHAERLGLHDTTIRIPFVLERYNMATADSLRSLRLEDTSTVSELNGALFLDADMLESVEGRLIAAHSGEQFNVIILDAGLGLLTKDGDLVEFVPVENLPFKKITGFGKASGGFPVLVTENGIWRPDADWLTFETFTGSYAEDSADWIQLRLSKAVEILEVYNGKGPSVYRVLLDLHSGRLFGWTGRAIMDLTAVAVVFLVISGLSGWILRPRGPTRKIKQ